MKDNKNEAFLKLQSWSETILSFLLNSAHKSDVEDWVIILRECCRKGHMLQMKIFVNELNEMVEAEMRDTLPELNRILREKFGEDLSSRMARSMAAVLRRGKIRNDDEFARVNEWIDHLLYDRDNPDAKQQIEQYNQLLRDYEEKAARRMK